MVMKTIGLVGGMTAESSAEYYRIINQTVRERLGGIHSGKIIMYSVDFGEMDELSIGKIKTESRNTYLRIIEKLRAEGAAGIILGCPEIPLLV